MPHSTETTAYIYIKNVFESDIITDFTLMRNIVHYLPFLAIAQHY